MYYIIKETLVEASFEECLKQKCPYVAVLSTIDWETEKEQFAFGIDMGKELEENENNYFKKEEVIIKNSHGFCNHGYFIYNINL